MHVATNQASGAPLIESQITYSTADVERAVFYGEAHERPSAPEIFPATTIMVVAGDLYLLDTETIPPGTPIPPESGVAGLADEGNPQ